jgi:hypothetical protein
MVALEFSYSKQAVSTTIFFYLCGGTWGTAGTTGPLYQPRIIGDGDCGEIGGMKNGRGNRNTQRKPAPARHSSTKQKIDFVLICFTCRQSKISKGKVIPVLN